MSRVSVVMAFVTVAVAAQSFGCAGLRRYAAERREIHARVEPYVHPVSCERIWPEARTMLFQTGYSVLNTGEVGTGTVETDWRYLDNGDGRDRLLLQTLPAGSPDSCRVQVMRHTERWGQYGGRNMDTTRDLDMEFSLMQRVSPQDAAQIELEAQQIAAATVQ